MKYDEDMCWYEEERPFRNSTIVFMVEECKSEEEAFKEIESMEKYLKDNLDDVVRQAIAEKLIELKHKECEIEHEHECEDEECEEHEEKMEEYHHEEVDHVTLEAMFEKIHLMEVGISKESAELYFDDSGIFGGNSIIIYLDRIEDEYKYFAVGF